MRIQSAIILEDYEASRLLLKETLLRAYGHIDIQLAVTVAQAQQLIRQSDFDLAIVDLNLPDGYGVDLIRELHQQSPETFCVVATVSDDDHTLFESLQSGAHGYLLKEDSPQELINYLQGIMEGKPPLSSAMAKKMMAFFSQRSEPQNELFVSLTEREREVLQLIAQGKPRKKIASLLNISVHTANDHVKSIYRKLKVSSSVEAARMAIANGISA